MHTIAHNGLHYEVLVEGGNITLQNLHQDIFLPDLYTDIERDARLKVATEFIGSDDYPEMDYNPLQVEQEIEEVIEARIKKHLRDYIEGSDRVQVIRHNLN